MNIKTISTVLCAAFVSCLLLSSPGAAAQNVSQPQKTVNTLSADDIRYNVNTGDAKAKGNVVIKREGATLWSDEAEGNTNDEIITVRGNVKGKFPAQKATLSSESATWTGDKTKKTDGIVEAFGNVKLTHGDTDKLNADYVMWEVGTENYSARGKVNGVFNNRALDADEAVRKGDRFRANNVRRYEDKIQKFILSALRMEGRTAKDPKTGDDLLQEMIADKNVALDYVGSDGLKTKITGNRAVYSKARGTIVVSGNAKAVRSDGKTVTADTMVVHEDTRIVEAKGNSKITFVVEEKPKKEKREADEPRDESASVKNGENKSTVTDNKKNVGKSGNPNAGQIDAEDKEWVEGR